MGLPVNRFLCASNANNVLTDFFGDGNYDKNRAFHLTISPSMDILVSSNLERLLYMLCGDTATADYMRQLSEQGSYCVSGETLARIREEFSAECCDDAETCRKIAEVWKTRAYLIDTHTGVAAAALDKYREASGDQHSTVVVSTASPFKFAADVCDALNLADVDDPLTALSEYCALPVPGPLSSLEERVVRFEGVADKTAMPAEVDNFI